MLEKYKKLENPYNNAEVITDMSKPSLQTLLKTTEETRMALEKVVNKKIKKSGVIIIFKFRYPQITICLVLEKDNILDILQTNKD